MIGRTCVAATVLIFASATAAQGDIAAWRYDPAAATASVDFDPSGGRIVASCARQGGQRIVVRTNSYIGRGNSPVRPVGIQVDGQPEPRVDWRYGAADVEQTDPVFAAAILERFSSGARVRLSVTTHEGKQVHYSATLAGARDAIAQLRAACPG